MVMVMVINVISTTPISIAAIIVLMRGRGQVCVRLRRQQLRRAAGRRRQASWQFGTCPEVGARGARLKFVPGLAWWSLKYFRDSLRSVFSSGSIPSISKLQVQVTRVLKRVIEEASWSFGLNLA